MKIKCPCCFATLHDFDHTRPGIPIPSRHISDCNGLKDPEGRGCGRRIQTRFINGTWAHNSWPIIKGLETAGKEDPRVKNNQVHAAIKRKEKRRQNLRPPEKPTRRLEKAGGI
jgi:hypothetical protein